MAILDEFGRAARERFARAINTHPGRGPVFRKPDGSINRLVPPGDRQALAALSRKVVFNQGPAKEAIRQKASWTVQGAFKPSYLGLDTERAPSALGWLENDFFPVMDLTGAVQDWHEWLRTVSKAIDRDGESFTLLTRDPESGAPRLLMIPAFQVRSRSGDDAAEIGSMYDGAGLKDGIGTDDTGRVVFYRIYSDENHFEDVPAAAMIHAFERDYPEQRRGFPAFASSLGDLMKGLESKELEILRQILVSSVLLMNKGGRPPMPQQAGFEASIDTSNENAILKEQVAPGIHYLHSDQELTSITHDNPTGSWTEFQTRLWKEAIVGAGWSYALVSIGGDPSQGTVARGEVLRARHAIDCRHRTLCRYAQRVVTYALATDPAAPSLESFQWAFSKGARLTIDDGREDRALLEAVKAGALSEADYQATKGRTLREHLVNRARALLEAEAVAAELSTPERPISAEELLVRPDQPSGAVMERPLEAQPPRS